MSTKPLPPDPANAAASIAEGLGQMFRWAGVTGDDARFNEGAQMLANGIEEALRILRPIVVDRYPGGGPR